MKDFRKGLRKASVAGLAAVALTASLCVGNAFGAARLVSYTADTANWTIPSTPMTNTVWKDADGNVVDANTEGATQYKVLTTWAEAWSTSGSDYLGMSNSAYYGNGGNGNATVLNIDTASKNTTVGIWATSANVNPNAYNWNTFYNLYQQSIGADSSTYSDWGTVTTSSNSSPEGGSSWNSESGVWCGFKYRPDVVTTNNNLGAAAAATYISYINEGKYSATASSDSDSSSTDSSSQGGTQSGGNAKATTAVSTLADEQQGGTQQGGTQQGGGQGGGGGQSSSPLVPDANADGTYDSSYYVYGDETYNPQIVSYVNASFYNFSDSLYELAAAGEDVIAATANNPGLDEGEALTWKTVNKLPRSSRYSETPTECALSYEKLIKGSAYYTLAKINDGTVDRKKVALVNTDFSSDTLAEGTVQVVVIDFVEGIGNGPVDGMAGWLPLVVDQLSTDTKSGDIVGAGTGGGGGGGASSSTSTPYQYYIATADDLATCDAIYMPESTKTATQWQEWIEKYATTDSAKAAAKSINYVVNGMPCATNGSNMTIEKTLYPVMAMDCIYPELFPNMQLSTFWCDAIYHLKSSSLASAMSWIYATSPLAEGASLTTLGTNYSRSTVEAKFDEGYDYYQSNKYVDSTLCRIFSGVSLVDGSVGGFDASVFAPSTYWTQSSDTAAGTDITFSDVTDTSAWYYGWVEQAAYSGLMTGYDNGSFGPSDSVSRGMVVTLLYRAYTGNTAATTNNNVVSGFSDVASGSYYAAAAKWAAETGITTGTSATTFEPERAVTREELATFIGRYAAYVLSSGKSTDISTQANVNFDSINLNGKSETSEFAKSGLAWCYSNGVITGVGGTDLQPQGTADRSQMAKIIVTVVNALS